MALPLLTYSAIHGEERPAIPLTAACAVLFLGIDINDDLADGELPEHWQGYKTSQINLAATTLLAALPQIAIADLETSTETIAKMQKTLAQGLLKMSAGQMTDLSLTGSSEVNPSEVENSVIGKSGEEGALFARLAAELAGATDDLANLYADMGRAVTTAGQIASDCHDLFQASHSSDLTNGTRSLPIALYLAKLNGVERDIFLTTLKQAQTNEAIQQTLRCQLRSSGVLRHCAFIVEIYCQKALRALEEARPLEPAGTELRKIINEISFSNHKQELC